MKSHISLFMSDSFRLTLATMIVVGAIVFFGRGGDVKIVIVMSCVGAPCYESPFFTTAVAGMIVKAVFAEQLTHVVYFLKLLTY